MSAPIHDGRVHAPFYVFLRGWRPDADCDLLRHFGRSEFEQVDEQPIDRPSLILSNDSGSTLVADDWGYHLWYDPSTSAATTALAAQFEVFSCAVGDVDDSFEFAHWSSGRRVRELRVDEARRVTRDYGMALPGELHHELRESDVWEYVLALAESIGFHAHRAVASMRLYAASTTSGPR